MTITNFFYIFLGSILNDILANKRFILRYGLFFPYLCARSELLCFGGVFATPAVMDFFLGVTVIFRIF